MPNRVDEFFKGTGEALKTCPKLYDDLVHPAAEETGKLLATIPRAINAVLTPFNLWIEKCNFNYEKGQLLLAEKLKDENPENIVQPEPYVAIPVIQAMSYSIDNDELRNLYANLLAKSMQKDTKDSVHPSFVEVIKQLSPFEAKLLADLYNDFSINNDELPIIKLSASTHTEAETINIMVNFNDEINVLPDSLIVIANIIYPKYSNSLDLRFVSSALDNLTRLKLIDISYDISIVNKSLYNNIINSPQMSQYINKIEDGELFRDHTHAIFSKGCLTPSSFGKFFVDICILE